MTPLFPPYMLKGHARIAMRGKFLKTMGATMLPALIISAISLVFLLLPPVQRVFTLSVQGMFKDSAEQLVYGGDALNKLIYGVNLLVALFYFLIIGGESVCLDIVRGREVKLSKIFSFYEKWYIACIWPVITLFLTVCADLVIMQLEKIGAAGVVTDIFIMLWQLLTLIIGAKTIFLPYVLSDGGCKNFGKAFLKSWKLVDMKCFASLSLLYMSFIGWLVLVFFTGFALIYVYPYLKLSVATLYHLTLASKEQKNIV